MPDGSFDLVFLDPPYRDAARIAGELDPHPGPDPARGRVIAESDRRGPLEFPSLETVRERRYGRTVVTVPSRPVPTPSRPNRNRMNDRTERVAVCPELRPGYQQPPRHHHPRASRTFDKVVVESSTSRSARRRPCSRPKSGSPSSRTRPVISATWKSSLLHPAGRIRPGERRQCDRQGGCARSRTSSTKTEMAQLNYKLDPGSRASTSLPGRSTASFLDRGQGNGDLQRRHQRSGPGRGGNRTGG